MSCTSLAQHQRCIKGKPSNNSPAFCFWSLRCLCLQAFAELNILLGHSLSSGALTDKLLRSYSRFTLQPRQQLWERYSKYAAHRANLSAQQMELLRFLLGCVLDP